MSRAGFHTGLRLVGHHQEGEHEEGENEADPHILLHHIPRIGPPGESLEEDTVRVVAAVAIREGKVLVCRRPEGSSFAGRWEFPGGKVEPGESDAGALKRELMEELAVRAGVGRELAVHTHDYDGRKVEIHFLAVRLEEEPAAVEAAEIRWVVPGELSRLPFLDGDALFVKKLSSPGRFEEWTS